MAYPIDCGDTAAFILEGENPSKSAVLRVIRKLIGPSESISADVFTYRGRTLVLARPTPPRLQRTDHPGIRLHRQ